MISFSRRRKFIQLRNQIKAPLTLNPFVFSRSFFIWTILGIAAGIVTGLYWIIISFLMRYTHNFTLGWEIILIMGAGGFIIGLLIWYFSIHYF